MLNSSAGEHHALPLPRHGNPHGETIATCDARGGYWVVCTLWGCFEIYMSKAGDWHEVRSTVSSTVNLGSMASFASCIFWNST